jgi:hypothetical protein
VKLGILGLGKLRKVEEGLGRLRRLRRLKGLKYCLFSAQWNKLHPD